MKISKTKLLTLFISSFFLFGLAGVSEVKALDIIPGLKGFGTDTRAAYGGGTNPTIYKVTNLNATGSGSLKKCVEASGPRICVFEVSGTIENEGYLKIRNPYITIAGQTAPSPGVMLKGTTLAIGTHDVLVQHIRVRPGDEGGVEGENRDGIAIATKDGQGYNIVVDHCSVSWGIDENIQLWYAGMHDITVSNCITSEGLHDSLHPEHPHSKGLIVGRDEDNIAIINNLFAHNFARNPVLYNSKTVVVNNLIYNSGEWGVDASGTAGILEISVVGNVIIPGLNSGSYVDYALSIGNHIWSPWHNNGVGSKVYVSDNDCVKCAADPWTGVDDKGGLKNTVKVDSPPVWPTDFTARPSSQVKNFVLANAGARPADRDSVDIRIINDVKNGTGRIIDSQNDVGGWPVLAANKITLAIPANPHADDNSNGYTNLEEWLHCLACDVEGRVCPECSAPVVICDYYIKNGGNNGKTGKTDADAWATIGKVNFQNFANGDVICFKRGSTFTDATLTLDGTSVGRSGIIVQDYGVGSKPWINGNYVRPIVIDHALVNLTLKNIDISGSDAKGFDRCHLKYINGLIIDGLDYNGHTGSTLYRRTSCLSVALVAGDIEIKNCTIQKMMKDTWVNTTAAWGDLDAHGILFWYKDGAKEEGTILVHDNIIHDVYADCVQTCCVQTTTNIYNNDFYNFGENAVDHKKGRYINVYNNSISSGGVKEGRGTCIGGGAGVTHCLAHTAQDITIRDNYFYDTPTTGIAISCGGMNNYKVYGNYFKDVGLAIVVGTAANTSIYNNVFDLSKPVESSYDGAKRSGIRVIYSKQSNTKIYNNSFYISSPNHLYGIAIQANASATGTIIKNNIIYMANNSSSVYPLYIEDYDNSGNLPTVQNNNFYGAHSNRVRIEKTPGAWKTYSSADQAVWHAAGHSGALFTNPKFTNPSAGNLTLQSTSPAINAGANLVSPYNQGLNSASTWPNNVSTLDQNSYGSWEIGAYVYANVPIPTPTPVPTPTPTPAPTPVPTTACIADLGGECCDKFEGQVCGGKVVSSSDCAKCCQGTCSYDGVVTCTTQGSQCCADRCQSGYKGYLDNTCPGEEVCCEACYVGGGIVSPPEKIKIKNPIKTSIFAKIIENTLMWSLSIIGSLALLMLIIGGVMYIGSAGDEQKVLNAKKIVTYTILGTILMLVSYAVIKVLGKILT